MSPNSIILATTSGTVSPTTAPCDAAVPVWFFWLTVLLALGAVGVAWFTGLLRPSRLGAVRRVAPGRPLMPLTGVMFAAVVVWLVVPSLLVQPVKPLPTPGVTTAVPAPAEVPAMKLVLLNATVPLLALVVLLAGDALIRPRLGHRLGFEPARGPRGLLAGVGAMALALPVVCAVMFLTEIVYRHIGYDHPKAHDLLKVMGEAQALVKYLAIAAAVLVAPLWEEALFRGHVQTLILEGVVRIREGVVGRAVAVPPARPGETLDYFAPAPLEGSEPAQRARPVEVWVAVVLASLMFTAVHQPWTWPPIFVLSLCFGLAYERTGNLWAPVAMHATFNGVMTAIYLSGALPN